MELALVFMHGGALVGLDHSVVSFGSRKQFQQRVNRGIGKVGGN